MKSLCELSPLALALALMNPGGSGAADRKPNILVILADDLGYGELGCQGYTREIPTPNIDSIADHGVRLTSGYVSGPYCSPTRAGFMTGRYQQRFGHEFNPGPARSAGPTVGLPIEEKTIGDYLKAAGYATGWFGKSHLGYQPPFHPLRRGFDEFFGFLGGAHSYLDATDDDLNPILRGETPVAELEYTTDSFGAEAAGFIEKHSADPWFVYLSFNAVHTPLEATDSYLTRFRHIPDASRRAYAAMQSALDDAVGVVLAKVREHDLEDDTLIIFFSDNGGPTPSNTSGNGPLRGYKAQTWDGGIRVPFLVQWKGRLPAGTVDDRPVIQLDILPTALAAAGVPAESMGRLDGVNLLPYLAGERTDLPHEALYWRLGPQLAIRMGDWKLVKAADGRGLSAAGGRRGPANVAGAELYNLAQDLGETTDRAEQEPEKVRQLAQAWQRWNAELVDPRWNPPIRGAKRKNGKTATPGK